MRKELSLLAIRKFIPQYNGEAPRDLSDHPFYGLNLDEYQIKFRDAIWNPERLVVICERS